MPRKKRDDTPDPAAPKPKRQPREHFGLALSAEASKKVRDTADLYKKTLKEVVEKLRARYEEHAFVPHLAKVIEAYEMERATEHANKLGSILGRTVVAFDAASGPDFTVTALYNPATGEVNEGRSGLPSIAPDIPYAVGLSEEAS